MADLLRQLLVLCLGITLSVGMSVLVMIYGWGLEPKSWWWIIGVGFFGQIIAQAIIKLSVAKE